MSWKPSAIDGSLNRRRKSPKAIPGRRVRDSGFWVLDGELVLSMHRLVNECIYACMGIGVSDDLIIGNDTHVTVGEDGFMGGVGITTTYLHSNDSEWGEDKL